MGEDREVATVAWPLDLAFERSTLGNRFPCERCGSSVKVVAQGYDPFDRESTITLVAVHDTADDSVECVRPARVATSTLPLDELVQRTQTGDYARCLHCDQPIRVRLCWVGPGIGQFRPVLLHSPSGDARCGAGR